MANSTSPSSSIAQAVCTARNAPSSSFIAACVAAGAVQAVHRKDTPPDPVGARREPGQGDAELARSGLVDLSLAQVDRLVLGVEHPDVAEAGLEALAEPQRDALGRFVHDAARRRYRTLQDGVRRRGRHERDGQGQQRAGKRKGERQGSHACREPFADHWIHAILPAPQPPADRAGRGKCRAATARLCLHRPRDGPDAPC
jgi:hypothetical protein